MGSELWQGSEKVWPNIRLLFDQPEIFSLPSGRALEPRGIVGELVIVPRFLEQEQYSRAGDFLEEALGYERGRDLLEFAYDWRQDVRESARHLAAAIDAWGVEPPITLIAHSLGTLVSRYYIERLGGKDKIGRSLLIGGPHQGTPRIVIDLFEGVGLLPFGLMGDRLREVIRTFPSVYQFLPAYPCVADLHGRPVDLLADPSWLNESHVPLLRQGREFQSGLGVATSVHTVCIYGYGLDTVTDLQVARTADGRWSKLSYQEKPGGDNRVPEHSAILPGAEIHPVRQGHGSLYVDNDVKARLKVELMR
jgi:pimeloyl-ACP methyl ester carboxylesterase